MFFNSLFSVLENINIAHFFSFIMLGDFNVDFNNCNHPFYPRLTGISQYFVLNQVMTGHTHESPSGTCKSLIDLVFMSNPSVLESCNIIPPLANSDHLGIHLNLKWKRTGSSPSTRSSPQRVIWRYKHADFDKANELLQATNWGSIITDCVDQSLRNWQTVFMSIMEETIPKAKLPNRKNLPWLNKRIIQLIRRRNTAFKRAKFTSNTHLSSKYKKLRNKVVSLLREAKRSFFANIDPSNTKQFWKAIKLLNKSTTSIPSLTDGTSEATSSTEKANMLNIFFQSCFNTAVSPLNESSVVQVTTQASFPEEFLCDEDEIVEMLLHLDPTKANGVDGISTRMLRATATSISKPLTKLFNLSLTSGKFPSTWKNSSIVPIPKNDERNTVSNYRPISLLPIVSKVLEKHVYTQLHSHLIANNQIANNQWGFLHSRSTTTALISSINDWSTQLDQRKDICCTFFDLRKAFDSVPHRLLVDKLAQLGLNSYILRWITDYLTNRRQKVTIEGECSGTVKVLSGVPQGSVLGPLLFLIYVNDINQCSLSRNSFLSLYADDMLLYKILNHSTWCTDLAALQQDIISLSDWVNVNSLSFNTSKCKWMLITRKSLASHHVSLTIGEDILERVDNFKYLGITIKSDLSWTTHIQNICGKARRLLGLLYRKYYCYSNYQTLLRLYVALVRPHLEYACEVWDPHLTKDINALESVQKFALRMCTKQWSTPYQDLLTITNVPSLKSRRCYLRLSLLQKIKNGTFFFPQIHLITERHAIGRHNRDQLLKRPFARTNLYYYSYLPRTITVWNKLPASVVNASSAAQFKKLWSEHNLELLNLTY